MKEVDLLLLHPPSTYKSPTSLLLHGMMTASVPSTPAAENYPIGFLSIANYIERYGFSVSICNIAILNSLFPRMRPERLLPFLRARVFGIDLQWAINTDGALHLAASLKRTYPHSKIVFGGLTATFFWRELMDFPFTDFIIRGDCAEYPLLRLIQALKNGHNLADVPNLVWKGSNGKIIENGISYLPDSLDEFPVDYGWVFRNVAQRKAPLMALLSLPYRDWLKNPSAAVITRKGCSHNCLMCGGSALAYREICGRRHIAQKSPQAVIADALSAAKIIRGPIFLTGDLRESGISYAEETFRLWKNSKIENHLIIETFSPATPIFFQNATTTAKEVTYHISAETHDDALREKYGRNYTSRQLEETISAALSAGCKTVRVFFAIGLPGQDKKSVRETVSYCGKLLEKFGQTRRLHPFISPLLPFLEPGSAVFSEPNRFGYRIFSKNLSDYKRSLRARAWSETLGYETETMERETLVELTYESALALNALYKQFGLITARQQKSKEKRLKREIEMIRRHIPVKGFWLQGESSYTHKPLIFVNPLKFRYSGILREMLSGLS